METPARKTHCRCDILVGLLVEGCWLCNYACQPKWPEARRQEDTAMHGALAALVLHVSAHEIVTMHWSRPSQMSCADELKHVSGR